MKHAFGQKAPFQLGMEEELLLVGADSRALAHASSEVIPRVDTNAGEVKHDVYEALVETAAPPARNAVEGVEVLRELRAAIGRAGGTVIGAGIHPAGAFGDVVHVPRARYQAIADDLQGLLRRTPTCALHFHIGMPDPETAIIACNRMREHLPLLQALAAHSPFWHGVDSGFDTARAQLFRGYRSAIIPRHFADWDDYVGVVSSAVDAADVEDYTFLWWDLRPHPRLGTLEVRAMDAQSRLGSVAGLAALVHALAVRAAHEGPDDPDPWEAIAESSFRAGRDGLRATLWSDGALRPLSEIAAATLEVARPYARDVGGEAALEEVERILREGNGADEMRASFARAGMDAVVDDLIARARP